VERTIEIVPADKIKALIAKTILGNGEKHSRLGSIDLRPHQVSASRKLISAIEEFGGALLADEVGMGKTFIALDVARQFENCIVVAPAALRDMWERQSERAGVQIAFQSFESLSRKKRPVSRFDLVIVDEAHHARNPSTVT
jgi:superfamily II DNA or RNA helicase